MNLVLFQHVFWWGSSSRDLCSPEEVWDVRQTPVGMYTSVRVEIPPDAGHVCDWFRQLYNHAFWPANVAQLIRIFIGLYPADTFRIRANYSPGESLIAGGGTPVHDCHDKFGCAGRGIRAAWADLYEPAGG